ncbi:MAG: NAD(P)H-hydrate dehydratase [Candidatus Brocadiaceae bacterium]|jgi:NAD(P)H-hydrate epimerase
MRREAVPEVRELPAIPQRPADAHKGDFGRVLVVAGSPGMTGAGCMAALAAQKAGAGLVTLALPASLHAIAEVKLTSAMSRPLPEGELAVIGEEAVAHVLRWAPDFSVVALGPGVGRADVTVSAVRRLVAELTLPVVVDADGLNALVGATGTLDDASGVRILTPHPGEMARLMECSVADVQKDRREAALRFAREHPVLLALKGAGTVVTDGQGLYVNQTGNPGMATGGTGDVLTGMAAGLLCQGLDHFAALQLAVFVHGLAGDIAARRNGPLSMTAEDVLDCVPAAFRLYQRAQPPCAPREVVALLGGD